MTTTVSPDFAPIRRPRLRTTIAVSAAALFVGLGAGALLDDGFGSSTGSDPAPAFADAVETPTGAGTVSRSVPASADAAERWAISAEESRREACITGRTSADAIERCLMERPRG